MKRTEPDTGADRPALPLVDEAATRALGAAIADRLLTAGRAPDRLRRARSVWLQGPLGAGKTVLARGLLHRLGAPGPIRSPSFALLEHYALAPLEAVHLDLYRLRGPDDLTGLGLADYDREGVVWLIEWPERAGPALPPPDLCVELTVPDAPPAGAPGLRLASIRGDPTLEPRATEP